MEVWNVTEQGWADSGRGFWRMLQGRLQAFWPEAPEPFRAVGREVPSPLENQEWRRRIQALHAECEELRGRIQRAA